MINDIAKKSCVIYQLKTGDTIDSIEECIGKAKKIIIATAKNQYNTEISGEDIIIRLVEDYIIIGWRKLINELPY